MAHVRVPLSLSWSLRQSGEDDTWMPVREVPSEVHVDLLANQKIPDPFVDLNEQAVQWVGEKAWIYSVNFPSPVPFADQIVELVFEGLDTFATVYLNGSRVLETDNMFIAHHLDVTSYLRLHSDNELEIHFDSALLKSRELVDEHSHEHAFLVRQTEAGRLAARKAQYHWGWDWGPILMSAGPWKPVYMEQYRVKIQDLWICSEVLPDLSSSVGSVFVQLSGELKESDCLIISLHDGNQVVWEESSRIKATDRSDIVEHPFKLSNPKLWHPLGYGNQSRYKLSAKISHSDVTEISCLSKSVGFRRVELVQEPDQNGKSFYLRVNNVDIFCGGSCWIPADSFLTRVSAQRYRDWVALLAQSNQVMIRVWGGGVYEHEAFFDACDELGILVWHDFQFACGSYPTYDSYLKTFEVEARQQLRRLRSRPSVVMWAGNNEDYQVQEKYGLDYDFANKDPAAWLKSNFPARYIYEHLLPKIITEEDPLAIYHPSSPWGDGKKSTDPTVGDLHQWSLGHAFMDKYQRSGALGGRFVSEFGFEGYPHVATINRMISDPEQRYPGSAALDSHNKAIGHERRIMTYVVENFRIPTTFNLASYAHLTQVVQAEAMRYAYKMWRRDWKDRKCGGVLVWQLNDCWPVISWAIVDYYLVRKPAFYAISRALRPLDVSVTRTLHDWTQTDHLVDALSGLRTAQVDLTARAREKGATFSVWVSSTWLEEVKAQIAVRCISIASGREVFPKISHDTTIQPNTSTTIVEAQDCPAVKSDAQDPGKTSGVIDYDPYVVHVSLFVDEQLIAYDVAWPEPFKYLDLRNRGISFEVLSPTRLKVSAKRPVKSIVFEEMEGLTLSDNGFDLVPGQDATVEVTGCLKANYLRYTYVDAPGASLPVS